MEDIKNNNSNITNDYLEEFTLRRRIIFTDISKFQGFNDYRFLWEEFLKQHPLCKATEHITVSEWNWNYDDKKELLIDIESYYDDDLYSVVFKDDKIIFTSYNHNIFVYNNKWENLSKRTNSYFHVKFCECDEQHDHCLKIIDRVDDITEYYDKDKNKISKFVEGCIYAIKLIAYDLKNEIYREVHHGFLVKEVDDKLCCYRKLVKGEEVKLTNIDKKLLKYYNIEYQKF